MTIDQQLEARQSRRMAANDKFLARMDCLEAKAEKMVGELASGKCYVFPVGGKYKEGNRYDLVKYLIRNKYVA